MKLQTEAELWVLMKSKLLAYDTRDFADKITQNMNIFHQGSSVSNISPVVASTFIFIE